MTSGKWQVGKQWSSMALGEERAHLHDLLCGAAKKSEQRVTEGLAKNAQARKCRDALCEVGIAAPRQRVSERRPIEIERQVTAELDGDVSARRRECTPFKRATV